MISLQVLTNLHICSGSHVTVWIRCLQINSQKKEVLKNKLVRIQHVALVAIACITSSSFLCILLVSSLFRLYYLSSFLAQENSVMIYKLNENIIPKIPTSRCKHHTISKMFIPNLTGTNKVKRSSAECLCWGSISLGAGKTASMQRDLPYMHRCLETLYFIVCFTDWITTSDSCQRLKLWRR